MTQNEITLEYIDSTASEYADVRMVLAERVASLQEEIAAITRRRLPGIKSAADIAAKVHAELRGQIEAVPHLFVQPRTFVLHGIKLGYQKGKGSIDWDDDERLAAAIKRLHPEQYDVLVKTTHKPMVKALATLKVAELKRLGCVVEETGDNVVIRGATDALDKLVAKLLEEGATPVEVMS